MNLAPEHFRLLLEQRRSRRTAAKYAAGATKFLAWLDTRQLELASAPTDTVAKYCQWLIESGYRAATVELYVISVERYLAWCGEQGAVLPRFSPAEVPPPEARSVTTLTSAMLARYLERAADLPEPTRTAVMLLPYVGVASRQLVALPLQSLRRLAFGPGASTQPLALATIATDKRERLMPLLPDGERVLLAYMRGWRRARPDAAWLFPGVNGHIADRTMRSALQYVRESAGLDFTQPTLRSTYFAKHLELRTPLAHLISIADPRTAAMLKDRYRKMQSAADVGAQQVALRSGRVQGTR